jgi:hypothetical protein
LFLSRSFSLARVKRPHSWRAKASILFLLSVRRDYFVNERHNVSSSGNAKQFFPACHRPNLCGRNQVCIVQIFRRKSIKAAFLLPFGWTL